MFLSAIDPNLSAFVWLGFIIVLLGSFLRLFKQPYIIAYIASGVVIGEHGFQLVTDGELIKSMGEFGMILLLFFIGMETSITGLVKKWKVAVLGALIQVGASVLLVALIGYLFDWQWNRIVVLGFVISLSSSAVIIRLLQDSGEIESPLGQNVISILLMQDIIVVPMLIITNYLGGVAPTQSEIILQLVGGIGIIALLIWLVRKENITLPFSKIIEKDHELQVFIAFISCFGFALLTAFFGLSAALGAFVGGMLVHSAQSTHWFHDSLHSFRIIFVALFFVSIGMLIDLSFLVENWQVVSLLLLAVYLSNHLINTLVLQLFSKDWKLSWYGGALLAQIGELSFVIAASAYFNQIISEYAYQLTIITIAMTLLISPFWVLFSKKVITAFPSKQLPKIVNGE